MYQGHTWPTSLVWPGQLCDPVLKGSTNNVVDAWHGGEDFRSYLGIAASNHHQGFRMVADELSYGLSGLHGRLLGDRAGVDNTKIRLGLFFYGVPAAVYKLLGDRLRLVTVELASQGRDGKKGHLASNAKCRLFQL